MNDELNNQDPKPESPAEEQTTGQEVSTTEAATETGTEAGTEAATETAAGASAPSSPDDGAPAEAASREQEEPSEGDMYDSPEMESDEGGEASAAADSGAPSSEEAGDDIPEPPTEPESPPEPEVDPESLVRVVGVKFRRATKTYFFNAGPLLFNIGEQVIVETDRGLGLARVATPVIDLKAKELPTDLKKVIRKANWNDLERDRKNREREGEALRLCADRVKGRGLPMKLVRVEYLHDASKAIFYFTAEHRVDFRDLVKDLARQLHTRIEMRQIGVRDETKLIGGLGPCGREVCCSIFLTDFSPVSVRMAKDQNLAMNPAKVSGLCGRLMCCLSYEHRLYAELIKKMPKKGKRMVCPAGPCRVIDINVLAQKALVEVEGGETMVVTADQLMTQAQAQEMEAMAEETEDLDAAVLESDDPAALERAESGDRRGRRGRPAPSDNRSRGQDQRGQRSRGRDNRQRNDRAEARDGKAPDDRGQSPRNDQNRDRRPGASPNQNRDRRPDRRREDSRRGRDNRPPEGSRPYTPPEGSRPPGRSRPQGPPEGSRPYNPSEGAKPNQSGPIPRREIGSPENRQAPDAEGQDARKSSRRRRRRRK